MSVLAGDMIPDTGMGLCGHTGLQLLSRFLFYNGNNLPLAGRDVIRGTRSIQLFGGNNLRDISKKTQFVNIPPNYTSLNCTDFEYCLCCADNQWLFSQHVNVNLIKDPHVLVTDLWVTFSKTTWSIRQDVWGFVGSSCEEKHRETFGLGLLLSAKVCCVVLLSACYCTLSLGEWEKSVLALKYWWF